MKTFLSVVTFIFALSTTSISLATDSFQEEVNRPSITKAAAKIISGGLSLYCLSFFGNSTNSEEQSSYASTAGTQALYLGTIASSNLLMSGVGELLHAGYNAVCDYFYNINHRGSRYSKTKKTRPLAVQKNDDITWNRATNAVRSLTNLTCLTHAFYRYSVQFIRFMNIDINPFSLSNLDQCTSSPQFFCKPITTPIVMTLAATGILYNLYELYQLKYKKQLRQSDTPLMSMIESYSEIGAAATIKNNFSYTLIKEIYNIQGDLSKVVINLDAMDGLPSFLYQTLLLHGNAQLHVGAAQMLWNGLNYIKSRPTIEIIDENERIIDIPAAPPSTSQKGKHRHAKNSTPTLNNDDQAFYGGSSSSNKPWVKPQPRLQKSKTHGVPDPKKARSYKDNSITEEKNDVEELNQQRQEGLNLVNELRRFNVQTVSVIDQALAQVLKFTSGHIEHIDGSESRIVFNHFGRKVQIKFETPHGRYSSSYTGFKLKKVLGAIETAYLYGWNQQDIENYMDENKLVRLYKIPNFLMHVLWTRPEL